MKEIKITSLQKQKVKIEVMYDEERLSDEEWFKIMQEKTLIDDLMNGKGHLLECMNDDESAAAMESKGCSSCRVR